MNDFAKIQYDLGLSLINYGGFSTKWCGEGKVNDIISPIDGQTIAQVKTTTKKELPEIVKSSTDAFKKWRLVPAPKRGSVVNKYALILTGYKESLSQLITLEMGKPIQEARGEVQEMIDICEFATGLSRQ